MKKTLLLSLRVSASLQTASSFVASRNIGHYGIKASTSRFMASSSSSSNAAVIPRAAVAVTVQTIFDSQAHYLLIQRKNPPDAGKWSLPGGKIELGEPTLQAAQRELSEETNLLVSDCTWHPYPFMTTDAIFPNDSNDGFAFHYLIAQCFAQLGDNHESLPKLEASDDAQDAKWWTIEEIKTELVPNEAVSDMVSDVIYRAEELYSKGNLNTE